MTTLLKRGFAAAPFLLAVSAELALGQPGPPLKPPAVPQNLTVPSGNVLYLKTEARGTQNWVCVPGANGPVWQFLGPQATLFVNIPWFQKHHQVQATTHFLSANPAENGMPRPTWQSSLDTSAVWAKAIANSSDPQYVAAGAIPWLLLQITGAAQGPSGGTALSETTYIQRVNTAGGVAPASGCDLSAYGRVALVPYTTDYFFYRPGGSR